MADLLIVGGGFAGVWAAMSATRAADAAGRDLDVLLMSAGPDLVIRPRLYEADPSRMRVPLDSVLRPLWVRGTVAEVTGMSVADQRVDFVSADGGIGQESFGRLILATGSGVRRPLITGASRVHDVDTIESAEALDRHVNCLPDTDGPGRFTAVVVGSGFTGIEVACELVDRLRRVAPSPAEVRVCLIELADSLAPQLGDGPRPAISAALAELDVEVRLGVAVTAVGPDTVDLSDGSTIEARTVVWTAGIAASPLTAKVGGRLDPVGRLHVDRYLRVPQAPTVFAAGDVAAADTGDGTLTLPSCQHAIPLGKRAGHNAAADLLGLPLTPFTAEPYATCLDLGPAGAILTTGLERTVVRRDAKALKRTINQERIYPPTGDRATILAGADPDRTWT